MGKKLNSLLGRTFQSKFKALLKLAISRLAILKNQRQVRYTHARSDVLQLLHLGQHQQALSRVELVIKEQNMLDVFGMVEGYFHLLIERVCLIQNNKRECPDELKEGVTSLLFAASRYWEFPELQEIRGVFTSQFGKEFTACAVDLPHTCGVCPKMIQKLSTRPPSLESRLQVLDEIASENGIALYIKEASSVITKEKQISQPKPDPLTNLDNAEFKIEEDNQFPGSKKSSKKYRNVAAAAREDFESAAYAVAALSSAVELSQSESQNKDSDNQSSPTPQLRYISDDDSSSRLRTARYSTSGEVEFSNGGLGFEKIHPIDKFSSESEEEEMVKTHFEIQHEDIKQSKNNSKYERSLFSSSLDSAGETLKEIVFDESDNETGNEQGRIQWLKHHDLGLEKKSSFLTNEFPKTRHSNTVTDVLFDENEIKIHHPSHTRIPLRTRADPHNLNAADKVHAQHSNIERRPVSVRTRRVQKH